ncbi:unnamed protein product [Peronospora destructor]|uniref:Uncharacterized protein n=1 Tax=Peronospora destructor TaxID=86335 RepID=A0AAV0V8B7_9STRA|nr:unnamed protein product [Peronospora destructor]
MELAIVEKKMEMLHTTSSDNMVHSIEDQRAKVQYERQLGVCETLKQQLEAMNATSGLFPRQQLIKIRDFATRVNKKKAYRKRAKLRRRADASIRRAIDLKIRDAGAMGKDEAKLRIVENDKSMEEKTVPSLSGRAVHKQQTATCLSTDECNSFNKSLDPETLTIDALITVRRAWDAFIAFPQTLGASTIPPHFVPPPPAPSVQWAEYVASSAHLG